MFRNHADSQADLERFIRRVAEADQVWQLTSDTHGTAVCDSDAEDEDDVAPVLLFFSDRAYAERARVKHFPDHSVESIALFDFLYRWLPGMSGDGVLAGPNWSGDLVGVEIDPYALRERIEAAMSEDHRARHARRYDELSAGRG